MITIIVQSCIKLMNPNTLSIAVVCNIQIPNIDFLLTLKNVLKKDHQPYWRSKWRISVRDTPLWFPVAIRLYDRRNLSGLLIPYFIGFKLSKKIQYNGQTPSWTSFMSEGSGVHRGVSPLGTPNIVFWQIYDNAYGIAKYKLLLTELFKRYTW